MINITPNDQHTEWINKLAGSYKKNNHKTIFIITCKV
jgi:hypothetical protein